MAEKEQALTSESPARERFVDFLREELTPYAGRAPVTARITIAVILTLVLIMTFRIPASAGITLYMIFLVARDTPRSAVRSAGFTAIGIALGTALTIAGATLLIDFPPLYFVFVVGGLFATFFLLRVLTDANIAINIALVFLAAIPLWEQTRSAETGLQSTLWISASMVMGAAVAALVEVMIVRYEPTEQAIAGLCERLSALESLVSAYAEEGGDAGQGSAAKKVSMLAMVGTGRIRHQLSSADYSDDRRRQYHAELEAMAELVDRAIDVAANLTHIPVRPSDQDRMRCRALADECVRLCRSVSGRTRPEAGPIVVSTTPSAGMPLLPELEKTVWLMPHAFAPSESTGSDNLSEIDKKPGSSIVVADAFTNPEYVRFALKGCLAATICYIIYTAVHWPGIATSVLTCLVTALSTIGASKQRQVLRLAGAAFGGLLGIACLVFLFPEMDSITSLVLVVAAVTASCAWIGTSSPRLSYFGLQTASRKGQPVCSEGRPSIRDRSAAVRVRPGQSTIRSGYAREADRG